MKWYEKKDEASVSRTSNYEMSTNYGYKMEEDFDVTMLQLNLVGKL